MMYKDSNHNIFLGIEERRVIDAEFKIVKNKPSGINILSKIKDYWLWIKQRVKWN